MLDHLGLVGSASVFIVAAAVIGFAGTYMSGTVDRLADRTGLGEALSGIFLLAAATSLPDLGATFSAALDQRAELAMSNITGSMAVNLAVLGIADAVYRKANLEHAAASSANLMQATLFITLLSIPLIATVGPAVSVWGVHPASLVVVLAYLFGMRLVRHAQTSPMWSPRRTPQTIRDEPQSGSARLSLTRLWLAFAVLAGVVAVAGWLIMEATKEIVDRTGLAEGVAGGVFTAVSTSLPELFTTIAAVRHRALTLAVSNILGTNFFNIVIMAAADGVFRGGSIYHAMSELQLAWGLIVILMTSVLLLGMVRRETYGIGHIGFESFLVLALYAAGIAMLFMW